MISYIEQHDKDHSPPSLSLKNSGSSGGFTSSSSSLASASGALGLPKHDPSACGKADETSGTTLGEDERFEVERLRCILLSQPGDLPLVFDDSPADKDSDEDPGDSRRLLKARNRSRIMVLATRDAETRVSEYRKSGAR